MRAKLGFMRFKRQIETRNASTLSAVVVVFSLIYYAVLSTRELETRSDLFATQDLHKEFGGVPFSSVLMKFGRDAHRNNTKQAVACERSRAPFS